MTRRILVIDDRDSALLVIKTSLEATTSWQVKTVNSALAGLEISVSEQFDAIILDVIMPELNGIEVFHQLQAMPATRTIPVVFLTVKARYTEQQELEALGAAGIITKPFEPDAIAHQIRALLNWTD